MIIISTDSTSDLDYLFKENNIPFMPICVILGNEYFQDGVNVTPDDVYAFVEKTGSLPKTAAKNEYDYEEFFTELTKNGDEVIHIAFSSQLSTCCACAITASEKFDNVHVIDSLSLSTGSGLLVMKAVDMVKEGKTSDEIVPAIQSMVEKVQASFIVSTMEYLHKGGRCSKIASFAASVLRIMPSLTLKNGKIEVGKKYMGNVIKNCDKYVLDTLKMNGTYDTTRAFITYTKDTDEKIVNKVESVLKENSNFKEIIKTNAGATITCHCGKGTIGILYINE